MSRLFYHVMQDNSGNLLFDVSGTMRVAGTATLATIYGDEALTVILPNPMTNHPSFGSFKCFLGAGDYDFAMAKAGYTFETLTGVQGHGTMAQQDADAVAITGGTILNTPFDGGTLGTINAVPFLSVNTGIVANQRVRVAYNKADSFGMIIRVLAGDAGPGAAIGFHNAADTSVGSIGTSATATTYNTSSDGRLKEAIASLPHALETVLALHPVQFKWKATGEAGQGFVAQEVQPLIPQAVCGDPTDPIPSMQMDLSRLVPHLVGAVQALAQQVEVLAARLAAAEARA